MKLSAFIAALQDVQANVFHKRDPEVMLASDSQMDMVHPVDEHFLLIEPGQTEVWLVPSQETYYRK